MKPTKNLMDRLAAAEQVTEKRSTLNLDRMSLQDLEILDALFFGLAGQSEEARKARFAEFMQRRPDIAKALAEPPLSKSEARKCREAQMRERLAVREFQTGYRLRLSQGWGTDWEFK
jgi:hypothetical protein